VELKKALRFTGLYDAKDAIVGITSGAGSTEAMDWASMLERMYLRYFERQGFRVI
jgi:peptide chain release factor 2